MTVKNYHSARGGGGGGGGGGEEVETKMIWKTSNCE